MKKPSVVFMGTPEFALPSLERLKREGFPILAVVTQPDRPRGRGRKEEPPPVKVLAQKHGFPVLQPDRVRDESFIREFRSLAPDILALVAFGQILPKEILEVPRIASVNVHPSLLPKYRGAAPMHWTLINGEKETGVTTMLIGEGVDAGDILLQEKTPVGAKETYDQLHDRLAVQGGRLLVETLDGLAGGKIKPVPQDSSRATLAPRIMKEQGHINWNSSGEKIFNLIRGLSSAPGAQAFLQGKKLKIFFALYSKSPAEGQPGKVGRISDRGIPVAVRDGYIFLQDLQLEGKRRMSFQEFARGKNIAGEVLT